MSFVRLIPLLLLVPALVLADGDKNFKVAPKQFQTGSVVDPIADMAIKSEKGILMSELPSFPLKENTFYLRHKVGPKEFQWTSGTVVPKNYGKLHAYSLKRNYLRANEVAHMRFYGSKNAKAFQDETDIYFDREYVYSPRVPKLFFIKNGEWQMLKEDKLPGVISFAIETKGTKISSMKKSYETAPNMIFPVQPGVHAFVFSAPDCLPYVDVGVVESGGLLSFKTDFAKVEKKKTTSAAVTVDFDEIDRAKNLEAVEKVYDKFVEESEKSFENLDITEFENIYPRAQTAGVLGVSSDDPAFMEYEARYKVKRADALKMWREAQVGDIYDLNKAIREKINVFEAKPLRGSLQPTTVEPVYTVDGETQKLTELKLRFGADKNRFDMTWKGTAVGLPVDSLYAALTANPSTVKVYLNLENNKPVWIYNEGVVSGRHHYRYTMIEFQMGNETYAGTGDFILPEYIFNEPEVQEWLNPKMVEEPAPAPVPVDTAPAPVKNDTVYAKKDVLMPSVSSVANAVRVIRDKVHGTVAMIDSGSFRFSGRVVNMSPFAIMTTEFTQKMFESVMNSLDSTKRIKDRSTFKDPNKPVHNVTWNDARFICQTLGGDLPSEAQWEFAGRADNNDGNIWVFDSTPEPGNYAVYEKNSYDMGSKSPEYGPQTVGMKKPNAWGLYDMSGNVAEWTRDKYFMFSFWVEKSNPTGALMGYSKIYKGGSWKDDEDMLNLTESDDEDPRYWSDGLGFRCVYPRDIIKE